MKITCHSCSAKYTVSDEKVQGKTVKMKCRKCGATIVVGGAGGASADAAHVEDAGAAAAGDAPLPAGSYLVNVADNDQRTMSTPEILDAIQQGVVNGDTYVWTDGMADWQAIADHPELSRGLGGAGFGGSPAAVPAPAPSPGYGASYGNGNGNAHAPLAAAASDSARPAARKETTRRGNDLFGGGGAGLSGGGLSGGLAATPSSAGKRDENSVLFSLSALTQAAPVSSRGGTTATKDDSGLIDLKALAATATPAPAAVSAAPMLESPALFPLGAAPAPTPAAQSISPAPYPEPKKSNMLIPLIIGGVVAVGAIIGVFFVVQGSGGPAPQPSVVYVDRVVPTPTETAAATPTNEATAAPTAEPTASASSTAVAATPKGGWKGGNTGRPSSPATAKTSTNTPTPPTTSKPSTAKKCGCAPGDLACAMKCSAK